MDYLDGIGYTRDLEEYRAFVCLNRATEKELGYKPVSLGINGLWFNMIACGWKKEEYREIKPFNDARLSSFLGSSSGGLLLLTNGMQPDSPRMSLRFKCIDIGIGVQGWGAPREPVYRIFIERVLCVYRPPRLCGSVFCGKILRYPWYGAELNVEVDRRGVIVRRLVTEK